MSLVAEEITDHAPLQASPWQARWLWLDPDCFPEAQAAPTGWWSADAHQAGRPGVAGLLRGTLTWVTAPDRIWLRVSADSRYRLWINERWVGRGPAMVGGCYAKRTAPNWWYYDTIEVTTFLGSGVNVLTAEVIAGPDNQTHFSQGHAGFAAELVDADANVFPGTWRGVAFTGYRTGQWAGFTRECDLGRYPKDWRTVAFNDQAWPELVETAPRPALLPHGLPPLEEARVQPVDSDVLTLESGKTVQVGFEHLLAGHLQFIARAAAATAVHVVFEEMTGGTEPETRQLKLTLPAGETVYESAAYFSARSLRMTASGPLELRGVGMLSRSQPVQDLGAFECSDPFLNDLWRVSRDTLRLCLQDIHLDSPHHQEALGDHGDYLVEMLMGYHAFGDYALIHQDLRRMALDLEQQDGAQFHTSYALLMPDLAADLLLFTGDADTARATLPAIRQVLTRALAWRGAEGLLSQSPNYMFVDWIEHAGTNYHHPPAAMGMGAMTAFAVRALRKMAWLCRQLGEVAEGSLWVERAEALAVAFRAQLFVAERGIFRDGIPGINRQATSHWLPPDPEADVFTRHTNILAVWAGIVSGAEAAAVLRRVLDDPALPEPQPYFQHYLFDALEMTGLFATHARRQLDLWRGMLAENPHSLHEMWTQGDWSHAWGGTPLVQLSRRVLGVEALEPGWRRVRLKPCPLDLAWARGVVPTPQGEVRIEWERRKDTVQVQVQAPNGIEIITEGGRQGPDVSQQTGVLT